MAPVLDHDHGIDGAEIGGLVVSRRRVKSGQSGNAIVAAGDVMKNGCSACTRLGR